MIVDPPPSIYKWTPADMMPGSRDDSYQYWVELLAVGPEPSAVLLEIKRLHPNIGLMTLKTAVSKVGQGAPVYVAGGLDEREADAVAWRLSSIGAKAKKIETNETFR